MRRTALMLLCLGLVAPWRVSPSAAGQAPSRPATAADQAARPKPAPKPAAAEEGGQSIPGTDSSKQWRLETLGPNHWKATGDVEIERDDVKFYADEIEVYSDTNQMTAKGNVVFSTATHRVSAERVEFNLKTKLGTFYTASGTATLGETKTRGMFGNVEPDVYFYGDTLEKIGERKYRITGGGFTTCVQPTPRWEMTSGSVVLALDDYALLKNMLLKVKGMPVLYLPIIYYPLNNDDRSTGFLIPSYGASQVRGHTISNAFFWALGKSHDATITYDWFSKTGQGYGGEYRYVASPASRGDFRYYRLAENSTETADGAVIPGRRSNELRGNLTQMLPLKLRARGRVDYFSDIAVQQTYQQNIYDATRRQRQYSFNLSGAWGPYTMSTSVDRTEMFFSQVSSTVSGSQPRVALGYAERPVFGSPVYASVNSEFASVIRKSKQGAVETDLDVKRLDVAPTVRFPFTRWPFLTVNSSVTARYTWWNKSRDMANNIFDESIDRAYLDMQARVVGPVLNRIWNPNGSYAEKVKHSVEPYVNLQRVTSFDDYFRIVQLDGTDYIVPGVTKISYGVANRVYAKQSAPEGAQNAAREILNVTVSQSYYTDAKASLVDPAYVSSYQARAPSKYSPISLQARTQPVEGLDAAFRAEYDVQYDGFRSMALQTTWRLREWLDWGGSWSSSKYFTVADPKGKNRRSQSVSNVTNLRFADGRIGGVVAFNYDIHQQYFIQRRLQAYYNVQCCGFAVDYQMYDFGRLIYAPGLSSPVRSDKRFNISITLAGLTTFSNFLGAFGGNTQMYE